MSWLRERRVALASLTVFTLLAGDFWRNLLSWWGWGAIAVALLIGWIMVAARTRIDPRRLPIALTAFLLIAALSTAWSAYPLTTALAVSTTLATVFVGAVMAATISLEQFVRAAGVALRWIIGLSLVFELVVAAVIRAPIFPFFTDYDEPVPAAFFWSRAELFSVLDGGRIQGIVGNANLLAAAAALGLIVFGVQLADRRVPVVTAWFWVGMSTLTLLLTQSATVTVAIAGCAFTLGIVVLARRLDRQHRRLLYASAIAGGALATVTAIALRESVLGLLGRSGDLTNRLDIWAAVVERWAERPIAGWGWVSYWAPWVEPYDELAVFGGVTYLQAHSAWLDVLMQLGILGLTLFTVMLVTTVLRCASWSIDPAEGEVTHTPGIRAVPALVMTLLVVQSFAESRLLVEAGLALLTYFAVASMRAGLPPLAPSPALPVRPRDGAAP